MQGSNRSHATAASRPVTTKWFTNNTAGLTQIAAQVADRKLSITAGSRKRPGTTTMLTSTGNTPPCDVFQCKLHGAPHNHTIVIGAGIGAQCTVQRRLIGTLQAFNTRPIAGRQPPFSRFIKWCRHHKRHAISRPQACTNC